MYALVQSQAAVLSYVEVYWLLAVASAVMFVASFVPPGTTSVNGNSSNNGSNTGTTTPSTTGVLSLQNLSHLNSRDTSVTLPNFTANALRNDSATRIIQNRELRSVEYPVDCGGERQGLAAAADPISDRRS